MKKKILKGSSVIVILFIIICGLIFLKYANGITLIQLHDNSTRQMMGYLITSKDETIVIDGGLKEDAQNLIDNINRIGGGKVDYWFITHPHMDHAQAFIEIVQNTNIEIGKVYVTLNEMDWYRQYENERIEEIENFFNTIQSEKIKTKVEEVQLGQIIEINNLKCEILSVKNPEITTNAINNSSMVIKMDINDKTLLFLADTGKESGEKLLEAQKDKLKADIVQMAHHGQNGVDENVYKVISPEICLWPTPEWLWNNDPGTGYNTGTWKTLETRAWMENIGVKENYIEKDGDITLRIW